MDIEAYKKQFAAYQMQAQALSATNKQEYRKKIQDLKDQAILFYYRYSNQKEANYQLKLVIFMDFDQYLKQLKRQFRTPEPDRNNPAFFHKNTDASNTSSANSEWVDQQQGQTAVPLGGNTSFRS